MLKKRITLILLLLTLFMPGTLFAAAIDYVFLDNRLIFNINFERGYSNFEELRDGNSLIISFDTSENLAFERVDFFDSGIKSAWMTSDGARKRLYFTFEDVLIEPSIERDGRNIRISYTIAASTLTTGATPPAVPGIGAYLRMLAGVGVVIVIILLAFALMKFMTRKSTVTDIPGIGRLLGKADIGLRKSLVFYELGEIVYILGVTENSVHIVDKITEPVDVNMIKAGFSRRKDFSSYMKFFNKKNDVKSDIADSKDILEEKLSSLRKK